MTDIIKSKSDSGISLVAAQVSFWAAALFVFLLVILHVIEPEFDPSWRFISEYELGQYGWVMVLAFLSFATSYVALFIAMRSQLRTVVGRIGLGLLLVSALGLLIGGIFTTDPITTSKDATTMSGTLHTIGGTIGIAMTLAALFIAWSLSRNPAWIIARRWVLWTSGIAVVCSVVFIILTIKMLPSDGTFGPNVLLGWPNRIEILAYAVWVMLVAWQAIKLRKQSSQVSS